MTQKIISMDGVKFRVRQPDVDGDGKVGGIENITQNFGNEGITEAIQPTELGESLRELNKDDLEEGTRMSGIDMRANLHHMEIPFILAMDGLVAFKFLPQSCLNLTRQKKRLSVSIQALGRKNIVEIVGGKREHEEMKAGSGFFSGAKSFLGLGGGGQ